MFNIFLAVFFSTLAFACFEPFFFIGYLISIALFGLYQAIFMANAGGAWDNAKKVVEVELKEKGTAAARRLRRRRHRRRSVQGHLVGGAEPGHQVHDAVRPARRRAGDHARPRHVSHVLAGVFFAISMVFVYRSFYGMRIKTGSAADEPPPAKAAASRRQVARSAADFSRQLGIRRDIVASLSRALVLAVALADGAARAGAARAARRSRQALHATAHVAPPKIDGRLDDAAWRTAPADDALHAELPRRGPAAVAAHRAARALRRRRALHRRALPATTTRARSSSG